MSHAAYLRNDISTHSLALSPEDAASLALADPENLQGWASARIQECTSRLLGLKTLYNSGAPINRTLPPEVLMEVFRHLKPSSSPRNLWYKVLHVCRLWRSLIFRTAAFWADELSAPRNLDTMTDAQVTHLNLFMDLSRTHALELSLRGLRNRPAFDTISSHSHHITVLHIRLSHSTDTVALNNLLEGGVPLLTVFNLRHHDSSEMSTDKLGRIRLDVGRFLSLRTLHLPWDTFSISGVNYRCRNLEIFRCPCVRCRVGTTGTENDSHFQTTLQAFPGLRRLRLSKLPHHRLLIKERLVLPALRTLYLQSDDREFTDTEESVRRFLSTLICPTSCLVEILFKADSFRRLLPQDLSPFPPISGVDHAEFIYHPEKQELQLGTSLNGSKVLCMRNVRPLSPSTDSFVGLVKDLSDVFAPFRNVTSFTIRLSPTFSWYGDKAKTLQKLLEGFPQVLRLDVSGHDGTNDILSLLQQANSPEQFLCPLLEELRIEWMYNPFDCVPGRERVQALHGAVEPQPFLLGPKTLSRGPTPFADAVVSIVQRRVARTATLKTLSITILPNNLSLRNGTRKDLKGAAKFLRNRLRFRLQDVVANITVQRSDGVDSVTLLEPPETDDEVAD